MQTQFHEKVSEKINEILGFTWLEVEIKWLKVSKSPNERLNGKISTF